MSYLHIRVLYFLIILHAGRAKRKIDELAHLLDVAKMNYRQLGGVLDEDQKKLEEERESARYMQRQTIYIIMVHRCHACNPDWLKGRP